MTHHLFIKFPDHRESIRARLQTDATFREVCADYEEICTWLAARHRSVNRSSQEQEEEQARELIQELEKEIVKLLGESP